MLFRSQAPLGMTLSLARRQQLLAWAASSGSWIIEDDDLSELQLAGRAAPALASQDRNGRVIYAGTFSKTISPGLRLGVMVVPPDLVNRVGDGEGDGGEDDEQGRDDGQDLQKHKQVEVRIEQGWSRDCRVSLCSLMDNRPRRASCIDRPCGDNS